MFRSTLQYLNYNHKIEFWRARPLLRGRAKTERTLGVRAVALRLQKYTRFRIHHRRYDQRARVRANVDAAAVEHGTGWPHLRNDIARQNVAILPTTQRLLAQYEPLAFRSLLELCSSQIVPPPTIIDQQPLIPLREMSLLKSNSNLAIESTPTADLQLKELLNNMITTDRSVLSLASTSSALGKVQVGGKVPTSADDWMDSWKDFQIIDKKVRAQPNV